MILIRKILLWPFSILYGIVVWLRNKMYDWRVIVGIDFIIPVIGVGNLSTGGTGKTQIVSLLVAILGDKRQLATLSRGYRRKTKGFIIAGDDSTFLDIGDEPFMIKRKFNDVLVTVGEDRALAIPELLMTHPETKAIILDDAYQHRSVIPGLNILLTSYHKPFYKDLILPAGNLRESKSGHKRADTIIFTKCPDDILQSDMDKVTNRLEPYPAEKIFFAGMKYGNPYMINDSTTTIQLSKESTVLLFCGIADPTPLIRYLEKTCLSVHVKRFPDHYRYRESDIKYLSKKEGLLITTEKDAARLYGLTGDLDIYVLPVESFILDRSEQFANLVSGFVSD